MAESKNAMDESQPEVDDPFQEVRIKAGRTNEPHMVRTKIILDAISEVIQPTRNPTAYLGAILASLQQQLSNEARQIESLPEMLYLFSLLIPKVAPAVLRNQLENIGQIFVAILEKGEIVEDAYAARHLLSCIGALLQALDSVSLSQRTCVNLFKALLVYSADPRPKVRKNAQTWCSDVTKHIHDSNPSAFPKSLAESIRHYCVREISSCSPKDCTVALHLLSGYLQQSLKYLPRHAVVSPILEATLSLAKHAASNAIFILTTMRCIEQFVATPLDNVEEKQRDQHVAYVESLCDVLFEQRPHFSEVEAANAYIKALTSAVIALSDDRYYTPRAGERMVNWLNISVEALLSDKNSVVEHTTKQLTLLLKQAIPLRMLKQTLSVMGDPRRTATPFERILVTIVGLLGYRFKPVWSRVLRLVSAMFMGTGQSLAPLNATSPGHVQMICELMHPLISHLGSLNDSGEFQGLTEDLHQSLGQAIASLGPQTVLAVLPLNLPTSAALESGTPLDQLVLQSRSWMLAILKEWVSRASLSYFGATFIPLVEDLHRQRLAAIEAGQPVKDKLFLSLLTQIWDVFVSFCHRTTDTATVFRSMAKGLGGYLSKVEYDYSWLPICRGVTRLILDCAPRRASALDDEQPAEPAQPTKPTPPHQQLSAEEKETNVAALKVFAKNFLPLLFTLLEHIPQDKRLVVIDTISAYASIADPTLVNTTFKNVLKKWLTTAVQTDVQTDPQAISRTYMLSDIAYALTDALDHEHTDWLFKNIAPQLKDEDPVLQKKAFKILYQICDSHPDYVAQHVEAITNALTDSMQECHSSAKKARLRCLRCFILRLPSLHLPHVMQVFSILLVEVILAVKEISEKTRAIAYDLLLDMAKRMIEAAPQQAPSEGAAAPSIKEFFLMTLAGLAGSSTHMKSGTVFALSRLFYEFHDQLEPSFSHQLVDTMTLLLQDNSREVVKSALGFIKVAVVSMEREFLKPHLESIITTITDEAKDSHNRFRSKIRTLLEILLRRFDEATVKSFMPEDLHKWLTNIKKQENSKARKKQQARQTKLEAKENGVVNRDESHRDYDDVLFGGESDDEIEAPESKEGKSGKGGQGKAEGGKGGKGGADPKQQLWLRNAENQDAPLDLLDPTFSRHVLTSNPLKAAKRKQSAPSLEMDEKGRLVIPDFSDSDDDEGGFESEDDDMPRQGKGKPQGKGQQAQNKKRKAHDDDEDDGADRMDTSEKKGRGRARGRGNQGDDDEDKKESRAKKARTSKMDGSMYKAKKAAGDVKVKGAPDPFAFVPLNPSMLNKRNKHKAQHQFDSVAKGAQKGIAEGKKLRQMKGKGRR
eukprot:TRINITY_DN402_c0_g1_i4.p1 TRINITY_DN402_c0_g1~~TRINITY_DN402_c0_g1_i4.p1  ORF type:complete len:1326 (-),score=405.61 TRINITY_DN402_c0_g1_i4:29-4006(-)